MKYMLDTNILIYFLKKKPPSVADKINALLPTDMLIISFITYAELLKGAENSQRKDEVLAQLKELTAIVEISYPNNDVICQHYAVQFSQLKSKGMLIDANDLWIACHALAEEAIVVTHNVREFERVLGLRIEDWVKN